MSEPTRNPARSLLRSKGLTLGGLPVHEADETKHFKMIGTTGTGKSTAIRELLTGALERGDRAVIADPDGSYINAFYDPGRGDVILNPFDARAARWDLFGEMTTMFDADQLSQSLIADTEGAESSWRNYARVFLTSLLRQLHRVKHDDVGELYRLISTTSIDDLRDLLGDTPAGPYLAQDNGRFFGAVRAVANTHLSALEHIAGQTSRDRLSVRDWIRTGRGTLFLPYRANEIAPLRGIISTWMRLAIYEAMSQSETTDQRLWFAIDELDALGQIDGLKDALARLRKFGGRCVLGFQSIAQVSGTYGRAEAQTIVENCGNSLILRCSASEGGGTARFASGLIGEREVIREQITKSRRPSEFLVQPVDSTTSRDGVRRLGERDRTAPRPAGILEIRLPSRMETSQTRDTCVKWPCRVLSTSRTTTRSGDTNISRCLDIGGPRPTVVPSEGRGARRRAKPLQGRDACVARVARGATYMSLGRTRMDAQGLSAAGIAQLNGHPGLARSKESVAQCPEQGEGPGAKRRVMEASSTQDAVMNTVWTIRSTL